MRGDHEGNAEFVEIRDALFSRGDGVLTKGTCLNFVGECLSGKRRTLKKLAPKPGKGASTGQVWVHSKVSRLLRSPVLKRVLTAEKTGRNTLHAYSKNVAVINRTKMPLFDTRALGLFLISYFKGQVIVDDAGFCLGDNRAGLIAHERLLQGVKLLDELPEKLRLNAMLIEDRRLGAALSKDDVTVAEYAGLRPVFDMDDCEYNRFIDEAMT